MKNRLTMAFVVLGLLLSTAVLLPGSEMDAQSMITHATSVILAGSDSHGAIKAALLEILDASLLMLSLAYRLVTAGEKGRAPSLNSF